MADDVLSTLRQAVHDDPRLQERLFALTDLHRFADAVCELASSQALRLEAEEVSQAMRIGRKAWIERGRP